MRGFQAKTIVAPVDFSEESIAALGTALDIADNPSDVHVVHVTPPLEVIEWVDESGRRQRAVEEVRDPTGAGDTFAGGFVGLFLVNRLVIAQPLDIITMLGFIILVGIVVNNEILTGNPPAPDQATVRLLDEAGVDFTYVGKKENCCGTPMLVAAITAWPIGVFE